MFYSMNLRMETVFVRRKKKCWTSERRWSVESKINGVMSGERDILMRRGHYFKDYLTLGLL